MIDTQDTREIYAKYFAEISYFDPQVGEIMQLLDEQPIRANAVMMVLSEHGSLFENWACYDAGLRRALIIRYPEKVQAGVETDAMIEYVDTNK